MFFTPCTGSGVGNLGTLGGHPVIQSSIKKFKSDLNKLTLLRLERLGQ